MDLELRATDLADTNLRFEYTKSLPRLLEEQNLSLVLSTYQAGLLVTIGAHNRKISLNTASFDQPMGICRTPTGMAVCTRDSVWQLMGSRELAKQHTLGSAGTGGEEHDLLLLARQAHHTGPVQGHDLSCDDDGRLWLVNTLFNGLVTIEGAWSFVPQWKPSFIPDWSPGDKCHLNGLASKPGGGAGYVSCFSESSDLEGWRQAKRSGGCLIEVGSGTVVERGLCMPHSPRLHREELYFLNSGTGTLAKHNGLGAATTLAVLPGFTRGLELHGDYAFVGLSKARDGLKPNSGGGGVHDNRCGIAVVELSSGLIVASLWFESLITEIFAICLLPGYRSPGIIGPHAHLDGQEPIWAAPKEASPART